MIVAIARIELRIPAQSLKEKRRAVRSVVDRVKSRFDVRLSEVGGQDTWQRAVLGWAVVGSHAATLETLIAQIIEYVDGLGVGRLVADDRETLHFDDRDVRSLAGDEL